MCLRTGGTFERCGVQAPSFAGFLPSLGLSNEAETAWNFSCKVSAGEQMRFAHALDPVRPSRRPSHTVESLQQRRRCLEDIFSRIYHYLKVPKLGQDEDQPRSRSNYRRLTFRQTTSSTPRFVHSRCSSVAPSTSLQVSDTPPSRIERKLRQRESARRSSATRNGVKEATRMVKWGRERGIASRTLVVAG